MGHGLTRWFAQLRATVVGPQGHGLMQCTTQGGAPSVQ